MYEVYTDMLRRNEEIGMSELDLQGPTSFHTKMDAIRPQAARQPLLPVRVLHPCLSHAPVVFPLLTPGFESAYCSAQGVSAEVGFDAAATHVCQRHIVCPALTTTQDVPETLDHSEVEQQYHTANKRLAIAKRIAGSSKQPEELLKSKELLKSELEAVEEAQYAARAYTLMVQLFAKVIDRVSNAVAEREAQKSIRPEFVSSIGCQTPGKSTIFSIHS